MKHYEFTYLTRQDMTDESAKNLQDKLVASIQEKKGIIDDLLKAYKKRLAYRVQKQDAAYVNTILLQMEPAALELFKKEIEINKEILRGLIIFYDPVKIAKESRRSREREQPAAETKTEEKTIEQATADTKDNIEAPIKTEAKAEKTELKEEVKKEEPKKKEPAKETETTEEIKKSEKETKEAKTVKPRQRKTKIKAELQDIEQKLDEILK